MNNRFVILLTCLCLLCCGCHSDKAYKDMPEELAKLCKAIDKHPNKSELYYQRALYYYQHQDIDNGMADIHAAIKLQPDSAKYFVSLSDFYFAQRETDLTEESLEKALQLQPDNNEARLKLAELYFHLRMMEQCNATLNEAIQRQSYNPKAYLIKAFMLKEQQDTTNFLRMLQLVIDQDPKEIKAYLELGYFYQKRLNPIAESYYQNALNVDPKNIEIHYNLAKLYQDLGKTNEAIEEYKATLAIDPKHIPSLNNLGYMYLDESIAKYADAVKLFNQALQIDPSLFYTVCNRGVAYEYLGEYDKARKDYEKALQLKTNFEPAILGLNRLDKLQAKH